MRMEEVLVSKEAKFNFIKGIIRVAKSDGQLDEAEWGYYSKVANSMGFDEQELNELRKCWVSTEKLVITFNSVKEKLFFFTQVIQLCWIDQSYTEEEKREIKLLQEELEIKPESISAIEEWVYEGITWNKKGDLLLDLE